MILQLLDDKRFLRVVSGCPISRVLREKWGFSLNSARRFGRWLPGLPGSGLLGTGGRSQREDNKKS
jgi:hypothetical protein